MKQFVDIILDLTDGQNAYMYVQYHNRNNYVQTTLTIMYDE